jgi:hypothetical protein
MPPAARPQPLAPAARSDAWARGMPLGEQREWLVDCFRLRMFDTGVLRKMLELALFNDDASWLKQRVAEFLIFCNLATCACVLPADWDSGAFLETAALRLGEP